MELLGRVIIVCSVLATGGCMTSSQSEENVVVSSELVALQFNDTKTDVRIEFPEDWLNWNSQTGTFDGKNADFQVSGKVTNVYSRDMLTVDPARPIEISGNFKNLSADSEATVYLGFKVYDQNGNEIRDWTVKALPGSDTVLSRKCNEDSTTIYVRDASAWQEGARALPVFFTETDYSDLPNNHLKQSYSQSIRSVTKLTDNNFAVEFTEPVGFDAGVGIGVRLHKQGGALMYAGGSKTLKPQESVTLSGIVQGQATMGMPADAWCPGAAYARLIVLVRSNSEDCKVQFDSIEAETLTENTL